MTDLNSVTAQQKISKTITEPQEASLAKLQLLFISL